MLKRGGFVRETAKSMLKKQAVVFGIMGACAWLFSKHAAVASSRSAVVTAAGGFYAGLANAVRQRDQAALQRLLVEGGRIREALTALSAAERQAALLEIQGIAQRYGVI